MQVVEGRGVHRSDHVCGTFMATVEDFSTGLVGGRHGRFLSKERGPSLGLHCIPLAACGEWTKDWGMEVEKSAGLDLHFEGEARNLLMFRMRGVKKFRSSCSENFLDVIDGSQVQN